MKKHLLALMALGLISFNVNAAVTVSADINPSATAEDYNFTSSLLGATFDEMFSFTLSSGDREIFASLSGTSTKGINFTSFNLLASDKTTVLAVGDLTNLGKISFGQFADTGIAGTEYYVSITGTTLGKGSFAGTLSLAQPVPEADSLSLMLGGLGLCGLMMRRRAAQK